MSVGRFDFQSRSTSTRARASSASLSIKTKVASITQSPHRFCRTRHGSRRTGSSGFLPDTGGPQPVHKGTKAARSQYEAWLDIVGHAQWSNPEDVKTSYPKASILKAGRVIFNIKGNDYRLVAALQYRAGTLMIRFFGTHAEYDRIDAE